MSDACCKVGAVVVNQPIPGDAIVVNRPQPVTVVTQILRGPQGPAATSGNENFETFTPTLGQTLFTLANTVINPQLAKVFLNGQKLIYLTAFNFTGGMTILTFISSEYILETDDTLEVYYFS